jgi:phosphate-selective porin OprO/OprP
MYFGWCHSEFNQPVLFAPGRRQLTSDLFMARLQIYF